MFVFRVSSQALSVIKKNVHLTADSFGSSLDWIVCHRQVHLQPGVAVCLLSQDCNFFFQPGGLCFFLAFDFFKRFTQGIACDKMRLKFETLL